MSLSSDLQLATWGVSLIDSRVAVGHKSEVIVQLFDGKKILLFPHSRSECDRWVDLLQRAARRKIGNYYGVTGLVGMGSFAEVRIGYDKSSGEQVAIKVMKKNKRDTELMRSVECEMNFISKSIDHENIVGTYDVFDTRDNLFIVMEYMPGGMLYDILANEGHFSEKNAASVMRDLLEAVHCLHTFDIVHRDIKPENVLAVNKSWPLKVKLADFGLADFVLENSFGEKSTCGMYGTPFFVAPEVIRAETYTPAVDIWSLGVLAYNMLSGKLPFDGNNIKEVLRRVRAGRYSFPNSEWADMSDEAKDFISGLLELNPKKRLTASEALGHPWLTSTSLSERAITNDRSALGYDQRKLRMSSMAIDDVAGLLRLDDEAEANGASGDGVKALSRLFPGKSARIVGGRSSSGSTSRSRHSSGNHSGQQHHRSPNKHSNKMMISNAEPMRLMDDDQTTSEISVGSSFYQASNEDSGLPSFAGSARTGFGTHGRPQHHNPYQHDSTNEESAYGTTQYFGGLEANNGMDGANGFALPAILSVKDIMRRRQAAVNGGVPGAVGSGMSQGYGYGNAPSTGGTGANVRRQGRARRVGSVDSDDDDDFND